MKNILTAPWMVEMIRTVTNMYDHGWDERNGGNVSLLLEESQVNDYVDGAILREFPRAFPARSWRASTSSSPARASISRMSSMRRKSISASCV